MELKDYLLFKYIVNVFAFYNTFCLFHTCHIFFFFLFRSLNDFSQTHRIAEFELKKFSLLPRCSVVSTSLKRKKEKPNSIEIIITLPEKNIFRNWRSVILTVSFKGINNSNKFPLETEAENVKQSGQKHVKPWLKSTIWLHK